MNDKFKDYFSAKSDDYANYRPTYPSALALELANLCAEANVALDCGCGTGQLSILLSACFEKVIATDASRKQIENAKPCEGVDYRVAPAEDSQLPAASVDLVTVAQAAHWLALNEFYAEVVRISKSRGIVALITYGIFQIDHSVCNRIAREFYDDTLASYWPTERKHVESGYATLPFPFEEVSFPTLSMDAQWDFHQLYGYITTWSAFKELEKAQGSAEIRNFKHNLMAAWGSLDSVRRITWPLSVRVGRVSGAMKCV